MTLAPHETARFYRVWWPLLGYVNAHTRVATDLPAKPFEGGVKLSHVLPIRDALWQDDSLRERFITENPAGLAPEDLALVASWSRRVAGKFYIYRHLKKHTVVLAASGGVAAYGVLGLVSPLCEVVYQPLPVLVDMVLLPFEDRITYDGLVAPYAVTFGPGIRTSLDDEYRAVRERGGVETSLLPPGPKAGKDPASSLVLKEFRKELAASGLGVAKIEEHAGNAEALAEALLQSDPPRPLLELRPEDLLALLARRGPGCRVSLKRLARFLERSGRVEWGTLQGMAELG
jgi:hypothetical protein